LVHTPSGSFAPLPVNHAAGNKVLPLSINTTATTTSDLLRPNRSGGSFLRRARVLANGNLDKLVHRGFNGDGICVAAYLPLDVGNNIAVAGYIRRQNINDWITTNQPATPVTLRVQGIPHISEKRCASASIIPRLGGFSCGQPRGLSVDSPGRDIYAGHTRDIFAALTARLSNIKRALSLGLKVFPCSYLTLNLGDARRNLPPNLLTAKDKLVELVNLSLNALTGDGVYNRSILNIPQANLSILSRVDKSS
jgi:hypothetical protein